MRRLRQPAERGMEAGARIVSGSSGQLEVSWRLPSPYGGTAVTPRTFQAESALQALVVEQALLLAQQLEQAAQQAPDGQVLAKVEALAVPAARELARQAAQAALQAQAAAAEKKGPRAARAPAAAACGTRGRPGATS